MKAGRCRYCGKAMEGNRTICSACGEKLRLVRKLQAIVRMIAEKERGK